MIRYSNNKNSLFSDRHWHATSEEWKKRVREEVESQNGDELLNTSTADLAAYYAKKHAVTVPTLDNDQITVDHREIQIDVSRDAGRLVRNRSEPFYVTGTEVLVEIPFNGDEICFHIEPTTSSYSKPHATISQSKLILSISGVNRSPDEVKTEVNSQIALIDQFLGWLSKDAEGYNSGLLTLATDAIEQRKTKLLRDKNLVAGLGFKMKVREGANQTYAAPNVRRMLKVEVTKPTPSRQPFKPEPILVDSDYEHILTVLENMVKVMEQSPGAFQKIDEESLRTHFLVQLNGQFSGGATGETFNYEGKTDILIKVDGKNIFIGECKFWAGEKLFLDTLDQMLSYLSWRDTKAAVLVFSQNKEFSSVLSAIANAAPKHSCFKKLVRQRSETSWTYLFGHKDDPNREITVTVQAYNVPSRIAPRIPAR